MQFRKGLEEPRTYQGFIRITGEDGLADDDTRYFTVEVKPAWRVLMAAPPPAKDRAKYLSQAIAPAAYQKQGRARFDCDIISVDQLAAAALDPYAAVCLLDPTPLDAAVWQKLGNYAAEGHGVAVFLGRHAQPIASFNEPKAQELLAGRLRAAGTAPRRNRSATWLPASISTRSSARSAAWPGTFPGTCFPCSATGNSTAWRRGQA